MSQFHAEVVSDIADGDRILVIGPQHQADTRRTVVAQDYPMMRHALFSTPGYEVGVRSGSGDGATISPALCSLIAARRSDGALFCAPLWANSRWDGADAKNLILANAAGDVVYTRAYIAGPQGAVEPSSYRLYKIVLGATDGPTAAAAIDSPVAELQTFRRSRFRHPL